MGREIKRVALDFEWPMGKTWEGFFGPEELQGKQCPDCENGYSPYAGMLLDRWFGKMFFTPDETGSVPFEPDNPTIRARAERNVEQSPDHYGTGEKAVAAEARRLAELYNGRLMHHLAQEDVDVLVEKGRLFELTHKWTQGDGWQPIEPPVHPTAAQVNEWSIDGFGHDEANAHFIIDARCEREGIASACLTCEGRSSVERYEGQRAESDAWEPTGPPEGPGWQVWETVSEGSPVSPVFATSDELADWIADPDRDTDLMWWVPKPVAEKFIEEGWAPSFASTPSTGLISGVEWIGTTGDDQETE